MEAQQGDRIRRTAAVGGSFSGTILIGVILLTAIAGWITFLLDTGILLDDALITYRYARNLAEGNGFVFNPGERVLGTTTPLLTLLLGLLGSILGPDRIPLISNVLMIASAAGAALFTCSAVRHLGFGTMAGAFVMAVWSLHPETLWTTVGGMETPLVVLFMAAGLWALTRRSHLWAGAFAALLFLTRIDGAFWAIGICAVILIEDRRAFARAAAVGAAIVAPWLIFATIYFGSPIPHSVIAKRAIGDVPGIFSLLHLEAFTRWVAPFFGAVLPASAIGGFTLFLAGSLLLHRRSERRPVAWLLIAFPWAFAAALYLGRSPLYFDWYLAPITYASVLVGGTGIALLAGILLESARRWPGARPPAVMALIALGLILAATFIVKGGRMEAFQRAYQTNETATRRAIGEWLNRNTPPGAVVAMEAIGYQAYYSRRKVIDLAGLVSPEVVRIRRGSPSNAEAFFRVLKDLRPDCLVLRSFEVDANRHYHGGPLFANDEQIAYFAGHYQEAERFVAPLPEVWGETSYLTIYRRLD